VRERDSRNSRLQRRSRMGRLSRYHSEPMSEYKKRTHIISYVSPHISLFPTAYALAFGTRRGITKFADDILKLYNQAYFENLIISGGVTQGSIHSEASIMFQALVKRGIREKFLILEDRAANTGQNVSFSREQVKDLGIKELLLIGKISSKRRYVMVRGKVVSAFRRQIRNVSV